MGVSLGPSRKMSTPQKAEVSSRKSVTAFFRMPSFKLATRLPSTSTVEQRCWGQGQHITEGAESLQHTTAPTKDKGVSFKMLSRHL